MCSCCFKPTTKCSAQCCIFHSSSIPWHLHMLRQQCSNLVWRMWFNINIIFILRGKQFFIYKGWLKSLYVDYDAIVTHDPTTAVNFWKAVTANFWFSVFCVTWPFFHFLHPLVTSKHCKNVYLQSYFVFKWHHFSVNSCCFSLNRGYGCYLFSKMDFERV